MSVAEQRFKAVLDVIADGRTALVLGTLSIACSIAYLGLVFGPFAIAIGVRSRAFERSDLGSELT